LIEFGRKRAKGRRWSRNVGHRFVFHLNNHNACRCGARHRSFGRGSARVALNRIRCATRRQACGVNAEQS
jgi:hypothetical protein